MASDLYDDELRDQVLQKFLDYLNQHPDFDDPKLEMSAYYQWNRPVVVHEAVIRDIEQYILVIDNVDPFADEGGPCELIGFFSWDDEDDVGELETVLHRFDGITTPFYGYTGKLGDEYGFVRMIPFGE